MKIGSFSWAKALLWASLLLAFLCSILLLNTFRVEHNVKSSISRPHSKNEWVKPTQAVAHLSQALQIQTISDPQYYKTQGFDAFIDFITKQYPLIGQKLRRKFIKNHSILLEWEGREPSKPALVLMAHSDVVPVETSQLSRWKYPPFSGKVINGQIWGRGALDDKGNLIAILEATEYLLQKGYQPEQTVYLAFGADEEMGGFAGNAKMAQWLKQQGVKVTAVFDEGLPITRGIITGVPVPVASIAVSEKGYASYKLTSLGSGGHSSMATGKNPITALSRVLLAIEKDSHSTHWTPILSEFFQQLSPAAQWPYKLIFANLWLSKPILINSLTKQASTSALLQSAMALTQFHAGIKDNVIPKRAEAIINFRLLPGSSSADIEAMIKKHLNGTGISLKKIDIEKREPVPASDRNANSYEILSETIKETFPNVVVAPNIMIAATDSRHYRILTNNIYRFSPWTATSDTISALHGLNEHISIQDFYGAINFYHHLIKNFGVKNQHS